MARETAENMAAKLETERDAFDLRVARDLRARIAELRGAHPSAVGYLSDQPTTRERQHRDLPRVTSPADYAGDSDIRAADDRRTHILDGDRTGGGHRHGTGVPGAGRHKGVEIVAIVESDGAIWTAWPGEGSPGVVKNPVEDT